MLLHQKSGSFLPKTRTGQKKAANCISILSCKCITSACRQNLSATVSVCIKYSFYMGQKNVFIDKSSMKTFFTFHSAIITHLSCITNYLSYSLCRIFIYNLQSYRNLPSKKLHQLIRHQCPVLQIILLHFQHLQIRHTEYELLLLLLLHTLL